MTISQVYLNISVLEKLSSNLFPSLSIYYTDLTSLLRISSMVDRSRNQFYCNNPAASSPGVQVLSPVLVLTAVIAEIGLLFINNIMARTYFTELAFIKIFDTQVIIKSVLFSKNQIKTYLTVISTWLNR